MKTTAAFFLIASLALAATPRDAVPLDADVALLFQAGGTGADTLDFTHTPTGRGERTRIDVGVREHYRHTHFAACWGVGHFERKPRPWCAALMGSERRSLPQSVNARRASPAPCYGVRGRLAVTRKKYLLCGARRNSLLVVEPASPVNQPTGEGDHADKSGERVTR